MSGRNGSTRHTAPASVTDMSEHEPSRPPSEAVGNVDSAQELTEPVRRPAEMMQKPPAPYEFPPQGMLDRSLQAQLGRQLRAIFSDVADEPVPDRFVKLLDALEAREKRR
jgi:Anti-sigma factor NepR